MKNQIISLSEEKRKVFGFSDEIIAVSTKKHETFESLMASTEKSGLLENIDTIQVSSLKKIDFKDRGSEFTISYDKKGKTKKNTFSLSDASMREPLVEELASLKDLKKSIADESKTQPLLLNLAISIAIPIGTWIFRGMAIDAQNGEHYVATGRRSGLKNLLASAVEAIGPTGVTILGFLALAYMLYRTYNRYKNPATEIIYA